MGVKIVIPVNCSDAIESTYPNEQANYFIEEYMWSLLICMEQYLSQHCRSLSDEVKRISSKVNDTFQIGNLLRLGATKKYIFFYGRSPIENRSAKN